MKIKFEVELNIVEKYRLCVPNSIFIFPNITGLDFIPKEDVLDNLNMMVCTIDDENPDMSTCFDQMGMVINKPSEYNLNLLRLSDIVFYNIIEQKFVEDYGGMRRYGFIIGR